MGAFKGVLPGLGVGYKDESKPCGERQLGTVSQTVAEGHIRENGG